MDICRSYNQFTGTLDQLFQSNFPDLVALVLSNNRLEGSFLSLLEMNASLSYLDLSYNRFESSINVFRPLADSLANTLEFLDLSNNSLFGDVISFSGLTSLQRLFLDYNQITGSIYSLLSLRQLQALSVRYSQLSGDVTSFSLSVFKDMVYFRMDGNHLFGTWN